MKKIILLMFVMIFLVGTVQSFEFDNVKSYNVETKEVIIKNSLLGISWFSYGEVGSVQLVNYTGYCIPGNCYAYYKLDHKVEDYSLKGSKYYNKGQTELLTNRETEYEIFNPSTPYEVPIYEEVCSENIANQSQTCELKITKNEVRYGVWNTYDVLTKLSEGNYLLREKIDVNSGETVDVVPNFYGLDLTEWATFTGLSLIDSNTGTGTNIGIQQVASRHELATTFNMT
ncbi:hypothetical protein LCGC14_2827710, partial [marine sediment metagenome]